METENQKPKLVPRWSYGKILIIYTLIAPVFIGGLMLTGFVHRSVSSYLSTTFTPKPKDGVQCFSSWDGSVSALVDAVKSSMNDPESFQHVERATIPAVDSLCLLRWNFAAGMALVH
ncbi:hypothetical protein HED52_03555 [Ochrobactrum ciceri]|uniref:Uncharacterized protein n=1 Tax=Brucella ciceri TaxID=391287 RepID=A0ABX1DW39_9HYPH|nr:hypothetical protein [Brucella ciceri]